jgi:hypothetical protein
MSMAEQAIRTLPCASCGDQVPVNGLFKPCGDLDNHAPLCFACIFVHCLAGAECAVCGASPCGAFAAMQMESGQIAPVALCGACLPEKAEGKERVVDWSGGRTLIPDTASIQ